ncbi:MAG: hypothetical protein ACRDM0_11680 [Thermoleophilaceae bacterium]
METWLWIGLGVLVVALAAVWAFYDRDDDELPFPVSAIIRAFALVYVGPSILLAAAIYIGFWLIVLGLPAVLILRYLFGIEVF